MAKTFDALKRAEEEKDLRVQIPAVTTEIIKAEPQPAPVVPWRDVEIPSGMPKPPRMKGYSSVVEEYQRMKYRIIHYDPGVILKSLLFCSPGRREGNSTVLIQFGQTLAAEGNRVLLVDGNLRNPYLHKAFRLSRENGFSDLLLFRISSRAIGTYIKRTKWDNLDVLTSGQPHPHPNSILQSDIFDAINDYLKTQWDWVLFDCSPACPFSDCIALAPRTDGIVLVIQAEKTRWEVAQDVRSRLEQCGGKVLGVVLNKRRYHIPQFIYQHL